MMAGKLNEWSSGSMGASSGLERAKDHSLNQTANWENCASCGSYVECPELAISGSQSYCLMTPAPGWTPDCARHEQILCDR